MKALKTLLGVSLLALAAGSAIAHDRVRSHVFIDIGPRWGPYYGPAWYAPPPMYYYPPRVEVIEPPVYIEQREPAREEGYWYYCPDSRKYYPYVKKCPRGWQPVAPTPSDE